MSKKYKVAVLPGDGIGNDVMEAALKVLDAVEFDAEYKFGDIGWEFWKKEGTPLPERTVELLKNTDCCLFGAITSKPKDEADAELDPSLRGKGYVYRSPIVSLRQMFNLHTNLRPCKAYKGNPLNFKDGLDLVVFRENTEGLYSGVEYHPVPDELFDVMNKYNERMSKFKEVPRDKTAISCRIFTEAACTSICRQAFEYAKKYGYKSVTVVEKPNVIRETSGMMVRCAREVAKEFKDIELREANIDAMCMWLVKNPEDYDVLVASNMFGDIVSDLCAQLVGGLGFSPSANIGDNYAVFEPTHGSAPKYAGKYVANPTAMVLSAMLMLRYLGEEKKASAIESAVAKVIASGEVRTKDMGGSASTMEMAEAFINAL